ncbi:hypothetical protein HYH03_016207 [Edaphochlamys debaryana]|uniref:Uncharacterized protein n=1 Tax=Edaphochlamys debaryana TaxID=47281 RepID=A0A836BRM8_9CHLO|nr:hypothetical protein HYH03_016207 [Edaphochlamys debaryana]|eukprot:KAG2485004.1 hypothetical protein HYH03_016207 [Edaphochlamys debaryana]
MAVEAGSTPCSARRSDSPFTAVAAPTLALTERAGWVTAHNICLSASASGDDPSRPSAVIATADDAAGSWQPSPSPTPAVSVPTPPPAPEIPRIERDKHALLAWCVWEDGAGVEYVYDGTGGVRLRAGPDEPLPGETAAPTAAATATHDKLDASSYEAEADGCAGVLEPLSEEAEGCGRCRGDGARLLVRLLPLRSESTFDWALSLVEGGGAGLGPLGQAADVALAREGVAVAVRPLEEVVAGMEEAEGMALAWDMWRDGSVGAGAAGSGGSPSGGGPEVGRRFAAARARVLGSCSCSSGGTGEGRVSCGARLEGAQRRLEADMDVLCQNAWTPRPVRPILPEGMPASSLGARLPGPLAAGDPTGPHAQAVPSGSGMVLATLSSTPALTPGLSQDTARVQPGTDDWVHPAATRPGGASRRKAQTRGTRTAAGGGGSGGGGGGSGGAGSLLRRTVARMEMARAWGAQAPLTASTWLELTTPSSLAPEECRAERQPLGGEVSCWQMDGFHGAVEGLEGERQEVREEWPRKRLRVWG